MLLLSKLYFDQASRYIDIGNAYCSGIGAPAAAQSFTAWM